MCKENNKDSIEENIKKHNSWLRYFVIIVFTLVFAYKVCTMDFSEIKIDITTILSLGVAFFAIWLSVIFYFKADEASNRFYNETYKFIKDTSTMLGKIEATFGEKLNNVERSLGRSQGFLDKGKLEELIKEKEEIENEKNELIKGKMDIEKKLAESHEKIKEYAIKISNNNKLRDSIMNELENQRKQNEFLKSKNVELEKIKDREKDITEEEIAFKLPYQMLREFREYVEFLDLLEVTLRAIKRRNIEKIKAIFDDFINSDSSEGNAARRFLKRRKVLNVSSKMLELNFRDLEKVFLEMDN